MAESPAPPTLASLRRASAPQRRRPAALTTAVPSLFDLLPLAESPLADALPTPADPLPDAPTAAAEPAGRPDAGQAPRGLQIEPAAERVPAPLREGPPFVPAMPRAQLPEPLPAQPPKAQEPRIWSVSGLVQHVRGLVERDYSRVTLEGEISNWRPAGSGHCYFTVKDAGAQLSAVMFRRQASLLRWQPRDGDAIKLHGQLSVFESRGQMQVIVEWMQQAGLGALLAEVQRLKDQLRREGLFERKRLLPPFPRCIGIITSLRGAALRDIVKVCRRRHAAVQLLIYPAAVQGPNCPAEIAAGLRWFNAHTDHAEVVLVARGGGSWEDLHGFDHEQVARAIAASTLPVITGIGHATDSTLADAAADMCAPTPSAAAELLTAAQHGVEERVARLGARLARVARFEVLRAQQRLATAGVAAVVRRVQHGLNRRAQRLDELQFRRENAMFRSLGSSAQRLRQAEARLARLNPAVRLQADRRRLEALRNRLERAGTGRVLLGQRRTEAAATRLEALSPLRVLERGYALVYSAEGHLLRSAEEAQAGQEIETRLAHGTLRARVL